LWWAAASLPSDSKKSRNICAAALRNASLSSLGSFQKGVLPRYLALHLVAEERS